ncbi:MAG: hypothetical protein ACK41D_09440 [Rubricoccaceae bacterium]
MNFLSTPLVARLLWLAPALMLVISVALVRAGGEQREIAESGTTVEAEVLDVYVRERSEITRGDVQLRFTPPGADAPVERRFELPLAFLKDLEQREGETIPVLVRPGDDQIVLGQYSRVQWVMTYSFAAMAFVAALGLSLLVAAWNRYLARKGDPATSVRPG